MTAKRWFAMLVGTVLLIAALICAFNVAADPFGVFGDVFFGWYSFDMTENPRAAKYKWLEMNNEKYDAYVLGASGASSLSPETLGRYTGLRWYNAFNYGSDMEYTARLARHIIENYRVEQLVLCLPVSNGAKYSVPAGDITYLPHPELVGGAASYARFLFANPGYARDKLIKYASDGYLQAAHDVFDVSTGAYDKSLRDAEPIGDLAGYLARYPEFTAGNEYRPAVELTRIGECMGAIREISELCERRSIELTVIVPPMLNAELSRYAEPQVAEFFSELADITDFWDFAATPVSADPRYFYDETHFRNAVGEMMLARVFGDTSVYAPPGFGELVTTGGAPSAAARLVAGGSAEPADYTRELTVYLYHNIVDTAGGEEMPPNSTPLSSFEDDMLALAADGYTSVGISELTDYVERGTELPEKPVLVTFDDGYMSNYELAFPVLKRMDIKAVIFAIGVSVGRDTYKDTGKPMTPHFGEAEIREMTASGLVSVQSHSYDMHQAEGYDSAPRPGVLRLAGESEDGYIALLRADFTRSRAELEAASGGSVAAFAYPYGFSDKLSEVLLRQLGVKATFSIEPGINVLVKGLPQSLYNLKRFAR
ncbi:MAG: polysaccharide deacetylase family protein [Oscillospiraceae bacterium]|jgi:peptidoglycan/xylan/chitin deacetylase (PgdA/CDA1 family)|nr:polysaccharide deacetylase family protein [Oscillospiraceae bacterium]